MRLNLLGWELIHMIYQIKTTEVYRCDNENEAKIFLEELKSNPTYEISKYSSTKKEKRVKGEIEDEWVQLSVTKVFNSERDPLTPFSKDGE